MSWIRFLGHWIIESIALISILGLLVKIFVTNSRKIDMYTQKMWDSTEKAQAFLQQVDHEFAVMNRCAKSIKQVFLNFGKLYKEISGGTKTLDEAMQEAKMSMPEEFRNDFLNFIFLTEDSVTESNATDDRFEGDSCSDVDYLKFKQGVLDGEKPQFSGKIAEGSGEVSGGN